MALKGAVFDKISPSIPQLFLTATCTRSIKDSFESMLGIHITHVHWPAPQYMVNRNVQFNIIYSTQWFLSITKSIEQYVTSADPLPKKVIIYSNQRTKIMTCVDRLEYFFDKDDALSDCDVLTLVGTLTKEEKAYIIKLFLSDNETNLNVLCATSGVGNAGLDSRNIRAVYRVDFPPSILDISQERGRAGRREDATAENYSYNLCFSLEGFMHLFKRIHNQNESIIDNAYRQEQENNLFEVARLLASTTQCYYISFERALGNPDAPFVEYAPCGHCPNCTNQRIFPMLNKDGVKIVLFQLLVDGETAITGKRTWLALLEAIRNIPNCNKVMFSSSAKSVERAKVTKAMFLLISFGILQLRLEGEEIIIGAAKSTTSVTDLALNDDTIWNNISCCNL